MPPWLACPLLIVGGYALLAWLGRKIAPTEPVLRKIVGWSYGIRVVLTLALFFMSFWRLPILHSLQLGEGFWAFGLDCIGYHNYGARIVEAWNQGIELPNPGLGIEYFAVVAMIYKLLGSAHPLYPALVNGLMAAANGLLAYLIVSQLGDRRAAPRSAALVSFWPSTLIWSTQLLKDSLSWLLIFLALSMVVRAVPRTHSGHRSAMGWVGLFLSLATTVILMTRLRSYVGSALSLAALLVFVPAAVMALKQQRIARCAGTLGIVLVVVISTLFARTLDVVALLSPSHPERGHVRLALQHQQRGDLTRAEDELRRAIALDRSYHEAYLKLGAIKEQQGQLTEALAIYTGAFSIAHSTQALLVSTRIAHIARQLGDQHFAKGRVDEAVAAYEHALQFHDTDPILYASLGFALGHQQNFEAALARLDRAITLAQASSERQQIHMMRAWIVARQEWLRTQQQVSDLQQRLAAVQEQLQEQMHTTQQQLTVLREQLTVAAQQLTAVQEQLAATQQRVAALPLEFTTGGDPTTALVLADSSPAPSLEAVPPPSALSLEAPPPRLGHPEPSRGDSPSRLPPRAGDARLTPTTTTPPATFHQLADTEQDGSREAGGRWKDLVAGIGQLDDHALAAVHEATPEQLDIRRQGFISSKGHSLMDSWAQIKHLPRLILYFPRALLIGTLAPFPSQWFDTKGSTGLMRSFSGIEMIVIYFLLPGILVSIWKTVKQGDAAGLFLLTFTVLLACVLSLVVANLGTLFRLRLQFLLPLVMLAPIGHPMTAYRRLYAPCRNLIFKQRYRRGDQPERVQPRAEAL